METEKMEIKTSDIKDFGIFDVLRTSSQKDETGRNKPPFDSAKIALALSEKPNLGDKVTVIPLSVNLEPFQLTITNIGEKKNSGCSDEENKFYHDIETEQVSDKKFLGINPLPNRSSETPFDVFVIYPAVKFAKIIETSKLTDQLLPKEIKPDTVAAAVDLDNDGKPDLLQAKFCCNNKSGAVEDCDYVCGKSFKKTNGVWKEISFDQPC